VALQADDAIASWQYISGTGGVLRFAATQCLLSSLSSICAAEVQRLWVRSHKRA